MNLPTDPRLQPRDVPFRQAGIGMSTQFVCGSCEKRRPMLGRTVKRIRGARLWVCAQCKERT